MTRLSRPIAVPKRPKGTAQAEREARRKASAALDRRESEKVKARSGGRCEAVVETYRCGGSREMWTCPFNATEIHHMIGGRNRSRIAESASALRKQHLCHEHHEGITGTVGGKRYVRIGGPVPHYTDWYRRVR